MPPKSSRKRQLAASLEKARECKRRQESGEEPSSTTDLEARTERSGTVHKQDESVEVLTLSQDAPDIDDESVDPTFDLESSLLSDTDYMVEDFCDDWVSHLDRDDLVSLGLFLCFQLSKHFDIGETKAAEVAGMMINKSDRTVHDWRTHFYTSNGEIPDSTQGQYQRSGILWACENLNKKATRFIRENANVKGKPNLTIHQFCGWVNNSLLPSETLEPGFPRKVSLETAKRWMHELGFEVVAKKKGTYVDGHERDDVVEYRKRFLRKMVALGLLNKENAPTEEATEALPADLHAPPLEVIEKTIILFHDETTFQANEDQPTLWAEKGTSVMRPKSKGSGIMMSNFIDEKCGYLSLTQEEYEEAKKNDPTIRKYARQQLEYGEAKEGYWTSDKFIAQIKQAVKIAEVKYPREKGFRIVWIFDHSSCHAAMPEDALDVSKMNVSSGGKQSYA